MPFDGNGNWTCNFNAEADRNANIKIEASRFDNILLADIAQSFENCLTKDMQVKPQQNFNANNFRLINVANPINGSDAVNLSTLNTKDGTAVHKAGTETITGAKTFTNSVNRQGSWTAGTAPSSNQTISYNFTDSTGTVYGSVNKFYGSNGDFYTRLSAKKTDGTGEIAIIVGYNAEGNARATAPTPDTTTNTTSTQISTTGWVNSVGNNVMHLTGTESIGGSKTFTGSVELGSSATAETKSAGTSGTSVATTAYVKACVPKSVGSSSKPVYTNSSGVITVCNLGIPAYSSKITFSEDSYTPTENGLIIVRTVATGRSMASILWGNSPIARSECSDADGSTQVVSAFVRSGNTYTINTSGTGTVTVTRWFVPLG